MNLNNEFTRIRLERRPNGVRFLVLANHDKRNDIGPQNARRTPRGNPAAGVDPDGRCLIAAGEGTSICEGADRASVFDGNDLTPSSQRVRQLDYDPSFLKLRDLPFPTIAYVQGSSPSTDHP